jgi:hypothetical protein
MELDFASFGVYSLAGKRHANEDRWVAFTHLHLCPNISAPGTHRHTVHLRPHTVCD